MEGFSYAARTAKRSKLRNNLRPSTEIRCEIRENFFQKLLSIVGEIESENFYYLDEEGRGEKKEILRGRFKEIQMMWGQ